VTCVLRPALAARDHNGLITFKANGLPLNRVQSYTNLIGDGVMSWWEIAF
jgi:hypothetical protein